jgi:superfamily II DNA or RNA helicase
VLPGNVLVLFNKVQKHGKPLYKLLKERLGKKKNIYYISGETKVDKRERIRKTVENEKDSVLVASYGTLSTGVNIKSLQYVIFASPYKSEIKVLQSIGRILRLKEGKKNAVLFDIVDDFRYKKSVNYSYKHFSKRFDIYKDERFPITISEYKLL